MGLLKSHTVVRPAFALQSADMMLAPTELARRSTDATAFRHDPLRFALVITDLVAADGHSVDLHANVGVRVVERAADIELFKEQFLDSAAEPRVSIDDVRSRLAAPLRSSLGEFIARHDAAACLKQRETIAALLLDRANEIGFACGIEFIAPVEVTVQSDSLSMAAAKARVNTERQRDAEQSARIAAMLKDIPAHLLPADQQASALAAILSGTTTSDCVYVVAGPEIATLDLASRRLTKIPSTGNIGPLRCARVLDVEGHRVVAIGGQRGVAILGGPTFTISAASERGFNSIAYHAPTRRIVATHGQFGVVTWSYAEPNAAPETFAAPAQARNLIALDERLLFTAGGQVCAFDGQTIRAIGSSTTNTILALLKLGERVVAVRESGRVDGLDRTTLAATTGFDHAPFTSAAALTAGGLQLLALAQNDGEIDLVTLHGEPIAQFRSPMGSPRMLATCGGWLIGASPDRASLTLWNAAAPTSPPQTISVLAPLGHRVADVVVG